MDGIGENDSTELSAHSNPRRRRARTMFSDYAIRRLDRVFESDQYPDILMREQLARELHVPEARIQTWFQNKRSRTKRYLRKQNIRIASPRTATTSVSTGGRENDFIHHNDGGDDGDGLMPSTQRRHMLGVGSRNNEEITPKVFFRPFLEEHCSLRRIQVQGPINAKSPEIVSHQSFSYTPMFNYCEGKFYLQPVSNMSTPMCSSSLMSAPIAITQVPRLHTYFGLTTSKSEKNGEQLYPETAFMPFQKDVTETPDCNLSAKEKLSSVAWLASSHNPQQLKRKNSSSSADDFISDDSETFPPEDFIDICS